MTADKITASGGQPMIWRYHQGTWSQITDPLAGLSSNGNDPEEELQIGGFGRADQWGELNDVVIWEKSRGRKPEEHWRIDVCVDGTHIRTIEVTRLPDLLDVLAKLAPISTASMASGLIESLQDVILNAAEDGRKEFRRRNPGLRKRNQKQ